MASFFPSTAFRKKNAEHPFPDIEQLIAELRNAITRDDQTLAGKTTPTEHRFTHITYDKDGNPIKVAEERIKDSVPFTPGAQDNFPQKMFALRELESCKLDEQFKCAEQPEEDLEVALQTNLPLYRKQPESLHRGFRFKTA